MDKPAALLEAEERLWASVVAGMEIDLGNRVPSVRAGGGRRKQIRADGSGRVVILALREIPYSKGATTLSGRCFYSREAAFIRPARIHAQN